MRPLCHRRPCAREPVLGGPRPTSMTRRAAFIVFVALLLASCEPAPTTISDDATPRATVIDMSSDDPPPIPDPGHPDYRYSRTSDLSGRWFDRDGTPLRDGLVRGEDGPSPLTLQVSFGPDHCDWQDIVLLDVAWPLGSEVTTFTDDGVRQYARDVDGVLGERLRTTFASGMELPAHTADTGYHRQGNRLLVSEADAEEAVFVVRDNGTVERWPRVTPHALCA